MWHKYVAVAEDVAEKKIHTGIYLFICKVFSNKN